MLSVCGVVSVVCPAWKMGSLFDFLVGHYPTAGDSYSSSHTRHDFPLSCDAEESELSAEPLFLRSSTVGDHSSVLGSYLVAINGLPYGLLGLYSSPRTPEKVWRVSLELDAAAICGCAVASCPQRDANKVVACCVAGRSS